MYDLLIKGGRVIDPVRCLDDYLDIATKGREIALIAKDIAAEEAIQVVDARNKVITPGLIDLHCHVYNAQDPPGVEPDVAGVNQGVTTVVDGGSAGQATLAGFKKYISSARTTVYCFLHIGSQGQIIVPELRDWGEIDEAATAAAIEANGGLIKGIKLRLVGNIVASDGIRVIETAQRVAKRFNLPLMVHIGDMEKRVSPALTRELLSLIERGDILTHVYTSQWGACLLPDGSGLPELLPAIKRGVVLDVGRGRPHLDFTVARKALARGLLPSTISSDLVAASLIDRVYGLTATMSTFMALGLNLTQVIEMSTINPARVLGLQDRIGSLRAGMEADISILELVSGRWELVDSGQVKMTADSLILPSLAVKGGQLIGVKLKGRPPRIE